MGGRRHLLVQLVAVCKAQGPHTCITPHRLLQHSVSAFTGLLVSETSSKETSKAGNVIIVRVVQMMVGRDGVSPHQISHTEIFESLVKWKVSNSSLHNTLSRGIWCAAIIPGPVAVTGTTSPDIEIRGRAKKAGDVRRITSRDVIKVANIARRVRRHWDVGE